MKGLRSLPFMFVPFNLNMRGEDLLLLKEEDEGTRTKRVGDEF